MSFSSPAELVYIKVMNNSFLVKYHIVEFPAWIIPIYECFTAHKQLTVIKKS